MSELRGVGKLSIFVEIVLFSFRLFFYVSALVDLYTEKDTVDEFYLVLTWLVIAIIVPICFWIPLIYKRSMYYCFAELLLNGSLTIYAMQTTNSYTALFIIAALTVSFHLERRYYWLIAVMAFFPFIEFILQGISLEGENPYFFIFNHWLLLMIGFGFNLIIKAYKNTENLNRIIEEQNQTLVQYAKQIEHLTLVEERNRMARDLHDTLGHSFIAYIVGLDAVSYLMDSNPSEAKKKIEELRDYASGSLNQVRETIHEIGTETDISLTSNLSAIIDEFSEYTNTNVTFNIVGDEEYTLQHSIRMTLLRCLQEGLTNAKRHGHAKEVMVTLSFLEHEIELVIHDNGIGTDQVEYGFGLSSMKERLAALNGKVQVVSTKKQGTMVKCQIPFRRG
ncbi:sensor histidine kinase [Peribacillus asahii]|uniref:histidine kinase n=1 Tax=Peribacillus asahii TaxID=228899 RepID=A0A398AVG9_9BACI|nr:sensor histidine kinase [Peribacillus asahii]RID81719.1 sensor histidine kinase [Peribacillus asahii]